MTPKNGLNRKSDYERLATLEVKSEFMEAAVDDIKFILQRIEKKFEGLEEKVDEVTADVADMKSRFKGGYWVLGALGAIAVGIATIIRGVWNH